jgi:type I restriction enzyme S subunit
VRSQQIESINSFSYDGEAVLTAGDGVGTGKVFHYANGKFDVHQRVYRISDFSNRLHGRYFFYQFSTRFYDRIMSMTAKSSVDSVRMEMIAGMQIPLPPLPEQSSIAAALDDIDTLLSSLDQLIAKKRDIHKAAMQQLISGQRRLPGFSGEWGTKPLGDIANIKTGSKNNQDKFEDGEYPFYVRSATIERIDSYSHDCEAILVPGEGNIGSIFHYINGRFDVHQRVYAITQFAENVSGKYIYHYMYVRFGAHAMQNSVKATVDSLRLPTFQVFEVLLPPTKEEQSAIAEVLTDMKTELTTLEARRDKAGQIKQGMMQELLTGRIRLV